MKTLRGRLLIIFSALAFSFVIIGAVFLRDLMVDERRQTKQELDVILNSIILKSRDAIEKAHTVIVTVVNSEAFFKTNCVDKIGRIKEDLDSYNVIGFIDISGKVYCSSPSVVPARNVKDRPWFNNAFESGRISVGDFQISRTTKEPNLIIAAPYKKLNSEEINLFAVGISLSWFSEYLDTVKYNDDILIEILDKNGKIVARSKNKNQFIGKLHPLFNNRERSSNSIKYMSGAGVDGIERLYAYRSEKLYDSSLTVFAGAPPSVWINRLENRAVKGFALILVVFIVISLFVFIAIQKWFRSPIEQAMSFSKSIAEDKFDISLQAPRHLPTEIQNLFSSLEIMRKNILVRTRELKRSEQLLSSSQRIGKIGGWEWDLSSQQMFWAEETYRIHEFDPDDIHSNKQDLIEKSLECYDDKDRPSIISAFRRCTEEGESYQMECRFTSAKGRRMWVRIAGEPVLENGRIVRVNGNIQDITELKNSEKALQKSNEMAEAERDTLRTLIDTVPVGVILADSAGRITLSNKSTFEILGGEITGDAFDPDGKYSLFKLDGTPLSQKELPLFQALQEKKTVNNVEILLRLEDEKERFLLAGAAPLIDEQQHLRGAVAVVQDITSQKKLEHALVHSEKKLRQLAVHLQKLREEDRISIAREIHDDFGQSLSALKMDLGWVKKRLSPDQPLLVQKIAEMNEHITMCVQSVKRLCSELRPGILDDLGLVPAIKWYAGQIEERTGLSCQVEIGAEIIKTDQELSTTVYRIVQESITNVLRHAHAKNVWISLERQSETLVLTVQDDGIGMSNSKTEAEKSFGILGMRERTTAHNGHFEIFTQNGKGTTIKATFPLITSEI